MTIITRQVTVNASPEAIWDKLIDDPNQWLEWLTPIRQFEESVSGPVRDGLELPVQIGNLGGAKLKVTEAVRGRRLRWKVGPSMMLMMGMGMKGTLEFHSQDNATEVSLRMVTPMMMAPMMGLMTGIKPAEEMTKTIAKIKAVAEGGGE